MGNIVGTVEGGIQEANLTAIDKNITPRVELLVRPINASSGRDAISVTANSRRAECIATTASFENVSVAGCRL